MQNINLPPSESGTLMSDFRRYNSVSMWSLGLLTFPYFFISLINKDVVRCTYACMDFLLSFVQTDTNDNEFQHSWKGGRSVTLGKFKECWRWCSDLYKALKSTSNSTQTFQLKHSFLKFILS